MRKDLEATYCICLSGLRKLREMMHLASEPKEWSPLAEAFKKLSSEHRQLCAALRQTEDDAGPDELAPVLVEKILALPLEHQALVLAELQKQAKRQVWPQPIDEASAAP